MSSSQALGANSRLFGASLTRGGGRHRAERIFDEAMDDVVAGLGLRSRPVEEILGIAIERRRPAIAIVKRIVGGYAYQVPVAVPEKTGRRYAVNAIVYAACSDKGAPMPWRLAKAVLQAFRG
jgi:ribosomal protein S7